MISIIICSRTPILPERLVQNIESTIGCNFEWIVIDNSENRYSIFEAYNLGIQKSKGKYLCFVHDDVLFYSMGWGNTIFEIFKSDEKIGLIGVAGAKVKTRTPSGWWNCPNDFKEINIIQHISNKQIEKWEYGFNGVSISEVVVIDGVFMVMRKRCNLFFDTTLKGFHNYDLNISIEHIIKGYKVIVTKNILLEHFSNGSLNKLWVESTLSFHKIYDKVLPIAVGAYNVTKELELKNGFSFLINLIHCKFYIDFMKLWFKMLLKEPFSKSHLIIVKLLITRINKVSNE